MQIINMLIVVTIAPKTSSLQIFVFYPQLLCVNLFTRVELPFKNQNNISQFFIPVTICFKSSTIQLQYNDS